VQDREISDTSVLHFLPVFDFISHFYQLFSVSCLFMYKRSCKQYELFPLRFNQKSSFVFLCIAWRLLCNNMADCFCVFIKDWKLIYGELFILKRKNMEIWGGSWHTLSSMHLPVKRTCFVCLALVQDKKISHR
jgi:hypothetical protein